jgi:ArsR family metal-binding transcriptional regulator
MFVDHYTLRIMLPDCNPSSDKVNATADLSDDISDLLPYLNTVLKGFQYVQKEGILMVKRDGHLITFRPKKIAITKLEDEKDAKTVMEDLKHIINETHQNRDHIKPDYSSSKELTASDINKLLPGTNCKKCGERSCFAFAFKLVRLEAAILKCIPVFADEYQETRKNLLSLLRDSGYEVPEEYL